MRTPEVYLSRFVDAYIECALWSSTDDHGDPLDDNYNDSDIAPATLAQMREDCADFVAANASDLAEIEPSQAGHDFWLTRCGHGAGFWDRGLGEIGERLTRASKIYGNVDLYVNDAGEVQS